MALPRAADATTPRQTQQAADGRHVGVAPGYAKAAPRLLANGYLPLPLVPGEKRPAITDWTGVTIGAEVVGGWIGRYPGHGVGLRTGALVGIDIDVLDPDLAQQIERLVRDRLGETLNRVGLWPKRLLPYRIEAPLRKITWGHTRGAQVEVLGQGQQFVAFGIHPATGVPYEWVGGTPLEVPFTALPAIDEVGLATLGAEVEGLLPAAPGARGHQPRRGMSVASPGPARDADGRVLDGRDGWLSTIAYHAVQDAIASGRFDPDELAAAVWSRFSGSADLDRDARHGRRYAPADAVRKVADKLRLHAEGRLAPRELSVVEPAYAAPALSANEARQALDATLAAACARIAAWHEDPTRPGPRIGIRATVGLGKSVTARRHLLALRHRLLAAGAPVRIVVFVPTHELAEEAAAAWREGGVRVAVLRGYSARNPATGQPMCRDLEAVAAAVAARLKVQEAVCSGSGRRCAFFDGCAKQRNRLEVAAAEVVIAAHEALFTGFGMETSTIGAILIDEGFWPSAHRESRGLTVARFATGLLGHALRGRDADDALADLHALRQRAAAAFATEGPVARSALHRAGLDAAACDLAIGFEARRLRDPGLTPGLSGEARRTALAQVRINEATWQATEVWRALRDLAAGEREHDGRLFVRSAPAGELEIAVAGIRAIHPTLCDKPILHVDATLRPRVAATVLPGMETVEIEALAPDMKLHLVLGSFGKSATCPEPRLEAREAKRRASRLREVVDYVAWHVRRVAPGRVLVVTYKACEAAFAEIPGVATGHFNAIAGLDAYRDVRLLVVVGRPLPSDLALAPLAGAFFRNLPEGGYVREPRGLRMRDGSSRAVRVRAHAGPMAELLRAAICDDEVLQAVGRGRGVNRTAADPLEVHVLADVALPLVHDEIVDWEAVMPDLVQRMLLAGVAVDSPGDAAALHPAIFANAEQAKKAMQRVFGGHFPIGISYRGMSLKSAAYRRGGRGRSWQRACWIEGATTPPQAALEAVLGTLAAWRPNP